MSSFLPKEQPRTVVKTINGVEVYLNAEGKFVAEVDGKKIIKSSLKQLEMELGKVKSPIKAFRFDTDFRLTEYEFIAIGPRNGGGYNYRQSPGRGLPQPSFLNYYIATPELIAKIKDLRKRYDKAIEEFEKERERILKDAKDLTKDSFKKE